MSVIPYTYAIIIIVISTILGILWALFNWWQVSRVDFTNSDGLHDHLNEEGASDKTNALIEIGNKINRGAIAFLKIEYLYCAVFVIAMAIFVGGVVHYIAGICLVSGGITSMICGYLGMSIATYANYRTAFMAQSSLADGFRIAYAAGAVMGFFLVSLSLLVLVFILLIFYPIYVTDSSDTPGYFEQFADFFDYVAGYGLGGSTVALFGRVGGGIYTKAADVGADLVGKVEHDLPEDSPRNPATIADNVGDNVGDIAGMGADLFGSFAESTCAALVVSAAKVTLVDGTVQIDDLMYPLLLSSFGILVCILVSFYGIYIKKVNDLNKIESSLKEQLLISTIILIPVLYGVSVISFDSTFLFEGKQAYPWKPFVCTILGLVSGLIIGYFTEYMTSHSYGPVREVANSCKTGAATNIIYGLALGYLSTIVPILCIAVTAFVSSKLLSFYGVALASLGMLSNLCIGLAIDGYGPISDNAGGIAEMAELGDYVRHRTDALDAAGNTTAAIGKGFAIGSAALVSLSLYGGFITRAQEQKNANAPLVNADIMDPLVFSCLLIGAMLPYAFSAFTMKSVGKAALKMVNEVRRQLRENPLIKTGEAEPDYDACIMISTKASLVEMIAPGLLVILSPIIIGIFVGPKGLAGLLPGALVSGVQMAISSANTGGAWDNAKKYIEQGHLKGENGEPKKKGSDEHKAAVIGDTVGDPLKDTSGPALNILVKLMAILSLVLTTFFTKTGFLQRALD